MGVGWGQAHAWGGLAAQVMGSRLNAGGLSDGLAAPHQRGEPQIRRHPAGITSLQCLGLSPFGSLLQSLLHPPDYLRQYRRSFQLSRRLHPCMIPPQVQQAFLQSKRRAVVVVHVVLTGRGHPCRCRKARRYQFNSPSNTDYSYTGSQTRRNVLRRQKRRLTGSPGGMFRHASAHFAAGPVVQGLPRNRRVAEAIRAYRHPTRAVETICCNCPYRWSASTTALTNASGASCGRLWPTPPFTRR